MFPKHPDAPVSPGSFSSGLTPCCLLGVGMGLHLIGGDTVTRRTVPVGYLDA